MNNFTKLINKKVYSIFIYITRCEINKKLCRRNMINVVDERKLTKAQGRKQSGILYL